MKTRRRSESLLELTISPLERGGFALAALGIAILHLPGLDFSLVSAVLLGVCAAGALHAERWCFDAGAKEIVYTSGFLPFPRKRRFDFSSVETLELNRASGKLSPSEAPDAKSPAATKGREIGTGFHREIIGFLRRGTVVLSLRTTEGKRVVIEALQIRHQKEMEDRAILLSKFCGLPLREL